MSRALLLCSVLVAVMVKAQTVDSLRIFRTIPAARYTTSTAESAAWKLVHAGSPYVSLGPDELDGLNTGLHERRPVAHNHGDLPGLSHIGLVYYGKRAHVFGLCQDTGLLVDLTARRQVRLEDTLARMKLKAALLALGL